MEVRRAAIPLRMGENNTPLGCFELKWSDIPSNLNLGPDAQAMDAERAGEALTVRTRQPGDRVQLLGSTGSKLLSDVLTDKKVPRALRDRVPLIEREGQIIWIAGIAPCAPCAIGPGSKRALIIKYIRSKE